MATKIAFTMRFGSLVSMSYQIISEAAAEIISSVISITSPMTHLAPR